MSTTNKLNASNVIDIRRNYSLGVTTAELADQYNVTQRTIQRVLTGEIWNSVPNDKSLKEFDNRYDITADGRLWSNTKNAYVTVSANGNARISYSGKKVTVNVQNLSENNFA